MNIAARCSVQQSRIENAFFAQAAATPSAPAIFFRGECITYAGLADLVNGFAADLARSGAEPGVIVALRVSRTPAMIALVLATLRSGAAYLPIDAALPVERQAFLLQDSGAGILITEGKFDEVTEFAGARLQLSAAGRLEQLHCRSPKPAGPRDLAYVIYTSGSTGAPKGVMLGHGATHLIDWARRAFSPEQRACVAATTSLSFDPAVFEIFVPLSTGGSIVLKENALQPFQPDERPTMFGTVPSVLRALQHAHGLANSIQVLNLGGERLDAELVRETYAKRPDLTIYNHYGPTEATTCVTVARVLQECPDDPPIGAPVRSAEMLVLSPEGERLQSQVGEIWIGGPGLALGYLNRPQLTAERFVFREGQRFYRTGDLGCWRGGELYFHGRADRQVKVRGYRVEPAEIEAAIEALPGVSRALVTPYETPAGLQLVAFVESTGIVTALSIRRGLGESLPPYMVPGQILVVRSFPRLVSGKIDLPALVEKLDKPDEAGPPASRSERPIIHVFEEVLGRKGIGADDSFFALGGDSLASVHAALRLEEVLGHELPVGLLHQAPSARLLAAALQRERRTATSMLSVLDPGGEGTPLFCVADLLGRPFNYLSLARALGAERPVYGLSPGPLQDRFARTGDVAALTDAFLSEIMQVCPTGPYLIAGYSAGGLFATEIAALLEEQGHSVRLVLLDSTLQARAQPARRLRRVALMAAELRRTYAQAEVRSLPKLLTAVFLRGAAHSARPVWLPRSQVDYAARLMKVATYYRPRRFRGPTLLVKAQPNEDGKKGADRKGRCGWEGVICGPTSFAEVPGGHLSFMRAPHVDDTARAVCPFLREAGADRRAEIR